MNLIRSLFIVMYVCVEASVASAQTDKCVYASDLLKEMAICLQSDEYIAQLPNGIHHSALTYKNTPITIEKQDNVVVSIGYSVFTEAQRSFVGNVRGRFIERFALYADLPLKREKSVQQEMYEEKIMFGYGTLNTLKSFTKDTLCNVEYDFVDGKFHKVKWFDDKKVICEMAFPINHELLLGSKMIENETKARISIMSVEDGIHLRPRHYSPDCFEKSSGRGFYVKKGKSYLVEEMTSCRYFNKDTDDSFHALFTEQMPTESLANLMTDDDIDNDYILHISLQKYNYAKEEFSVSLKKWIHYCLLQGCMPYFSVVAANNDVIDGLVIMNNKEMGYNHVMRIKFDSQSIASRKGIIEARLNVFVPSSNIKDLYYERMHK